MIQPQFQYTRLAYQARAVDSVEQVFADVRFIAPADVHANPTFAPHEAAATLRANIERIRADNQIDAGTVQVASTATPALPTPALQLDVLMETGTGKTFTFIETMHRLYQSITAVRYRKPCLIGIYVLSIDQALLGASITVFLRRYGHTLACCIRLERFILG